MRQAVLSPGSRNLPVVHSMEQDPDFKFHSIVDERSAGYFAIGLALQAQEPVVISCTSGPASTNYTSALAEAGKQGIPLIALTSDRNQYYLDQMEDQMLPQAGMYRNLVRRSVTLPIVSDEKDYWYCRRIINEALLELDHGEGGPIHINIPTEWGLFAQNFQTQKLPSLKPIHRISYKDLHRRNHQLVDQLHAKKRILVIYGQARPVPPEVIDTIEKFADEYKCVIASETISNMSCDRSINTYLLSQVLSKETFLDLAPDLVISVHGDYASKIKNLLKGTTVEFEHWSVNEDGSVVDQFKKLTRVFECHPQDFFEYFAENSLTASDESGYLKLWQDAINDIGIPQFDFSSSYAVMEFLNLLPPNSLYHHSNGFPVHLSQLRSIDPSIENYCHRGTGTIDGALSTFIGQASAFDGPAFMCLGDLGFFYDMNAIWNRYVGKNIHIMLLNNGGGGTFHANNAKDIESVDLHTAAAHDAIARAWVESRGFKYLSAASKAELDEVLPDFVTGDHGSPVFLEVFTTMSEDARILLEQYEACRRNLSDARDQISG